MNQRWFIVALIVSATLAFAGATQASAAASSPPAPLRAAASPRHSAAGASATATHAVRSHRGRKHHRRHTAERVQLIARNPNGAAGGSPQQPARHAPVPAHHAALRPASREFRNLFKSRTGGHGPQAEAPARFAVTTGSNRIHPCSAPPLISNEDRVGLGRGPPMAGIRFEASPSRHEVLGSTAFPTIHPNTTRSERADVTAPGIPVASRFVTGTAPEPSPLRPPGGRGGVFGLPSLGDTI